MLPNDLDNKSNKSTRLGSVKAALPTWAKFKFSCVATFTAILAALLKLASIANPSEKLDNPSFNFSLDAFQPWLVSLIVIYFLTGRMTIINLSLSIRPLAKILLIKFWDDAQSIVPQEKRFLWDDALSIVLTIFARSLLIITIKSAC